MGKITFTVSMISLVMVGLSWLAEARLSLPVVPAHLTYNSETNVYQLQDPVQFANQTLEQRLLTIRSINRHEEQMATKAHRIASH